MNKQIREGDLYKRVHSFGECFELYYGYYEDFERGHTDPIPIYPDFLREPRYTAQGYPFATQMQDMCEQGVFRRQGLQDQCCGNCIHFAQGEDLLGICICREKRGKTLSNASQGVRLNEPNEINQQHMINGGNENETAV